MEDITTGNGKTANKMGGANAHTQTTGTTMGNGKTAKEMGEANAHAPTKENCGMSRPRPSSCLRAAGHARPRKNGRAWTSTSWRTNQNLSTHI